MKDELNKTRAFTTSDQSQTTSMTTHVTNSHIADDQNKRINLHMNKVQIPED